MLQFIQLMVELFSAWLLAMFVMIVVSAIVGWIVRLPSKQG